MLALLKTRSGKIAILGMITLLSSYPYIFECLFPIPPIQITGPFFLLVYLLIYIQSTKFNSGKLPSFILYSFILQGITWFLYTVIHGDTTYITRIFYVVWTYLMVCVFIRYKAVNTFVTINTGFVALQAALGLIAFLLVFSNLLKPIIYYKLTNMQDGYCYLITCTNLAGDGFLRAAGYFDEPGALAFWGVYALIFNKLFVQNKYIESALLIGLFSTLSAAFFVQGLMYIIFFKLSHLKKNFIPLLFFIALIGYGWSKMSDNAVIRSYTVERFEGGEIRSMRHELAEKAKKQFLAHPVFGVGGQNLHDGEYMDDNQYEIFAKDGIVGFVVTYIPLFIVLFKCKRRELILGSLILMAGYYQRPFHMNLIHFLNLYFFCLLGYYKYFRKKICNSQTQPLLQS